ncbi:MAG: TIGR03960 family B12-binding radical SAM protein [Desulfovibrionaceae bacterium]
MRHLLPLLPKPTHYLGAEPGAVKKDPASVSARVALAFPDLYEVGMSYMGHAILYDTVNARPDLWAERVYAPTKEAAAILRAHATPLATLESDTPLADMDVIGFSLTHELCYTNVLYMLDLAGLPLRAADRGDGGPLVLAGGGCAFNAEPLAPFLDCLVLGDGEDVLIEILDTVAAAKRDGVGKAALLERLAALPGVYVPAFFAPGPDGAMAPAGPGPAQVEKRIVADLNSASFPRRQPQAFDAVHDRYTIEIARGCTRGCRFCQAGMIYRPVRERTLDGLEAIINEGLDTSGYGEISFLALSAGDFSTLSGLFERSFPRCLAEQVGISLPSLRVGSVNEEIMRLIAGIRRTGATLAPEAGSQRLRDVINKGVTEEALLEHVRTLFDNGWSSVKLYFMIGLPTETEADLDAILDLCRKVAAVGQGKRRLQVTASISPFVPKPHTPFQWEAQIAYEEIRARVGRLLDIFRPHRKLRLKWHAPEMSWLEGVFSRGDRALAEVVERAYHKGALFASWMDHLDLVPWREAMDEAGIVPAAYQGARAIDAPLPWDHLASGVTRQFLLRERQRALDAATSPDCRFGACLNCGVCNTDGRASTLAAQAAHTDIRPVLNQAVRDQETPRPETAASGTAGNETAASEAPPRESLPPAAPEQAEAAAITVKAAHYRIWFDKLGPSAYLSQLELQSVLERAMRRARIPMAFSQGFHPMPLISFARALPVGVESRAEYCNVFLCRRLDAATLGAHLSPQLPEGMVVTAVDVLGPGKKQSQAVAEDFLLTFTDATAAAGLAAWRRFADAPVFSWTRQTKKGERTLDIRPLVRDVVFTADGCVAFTLDWSVTYVSPLGLVQAVMPEAGLTGFGLTKLRQRFPEDDPA